MSETKRRAPAIGQPAGPFGWPRFTPQVPGIVPAAATSPVIGYRYGQDVLAGPQAFILPRFLPFPYWQSAPANPVIGFRYGRDVLAWPDAFVPPTYQRFPYFEQPANPPVPFRYGRDVLDAPSAFVLAQHLRFPYFQESITPANPAIAYLRGQWLGDSVQPLVGGGSRYLSFPYFEQPAPAPANIVLPLRLRLLSELSDPAMGTFSAMPRYYPLVLPSSAVAVAARVTKGRSAYKRRFRNSLLDYLPEG